MYPHNGACGEDVCGGNGAAVCLRKFVDGIAAIEGVGLLGYPVSFEVCWFVSRYLFLKPTASFVVDSSFPFLLASRLYKEEEERSRGRRKKKSFGDTEG